MKNKKKGVLIAVVVIALIVVAVAAVCINKKAGDSGKLKEGQTCLLYTSDAADD